MRSESAGDLALLEFAFRLEEVRLSFSLPFPESCSFGRRQELALMLGEVGTFLAFSFPEPSIGPEEVLLSLGSSRMFFVTLSSIARCKLPFLAIGVGLGGGPSLLIYLPLVPDDPSPFELALELGFELDGEADGGVRGALLIPSPNGGNVIPEVDPGTTPFPFCPDPGVIGLKYLFRLGVLLKLDLRRIHAKVSMFPLSASGSGADVSMDVALQTKNVAVTFLVLGICFFQVPLSFLGVGFFNWSHFRSR